ncbi:MAG: SIS domain-containing protein, partial [Trichlorobacter sp.]
MSRIIAEGKKLIRAEADAVMALVDKIDDAFVAAVEMILASSGRVVVTGMGKSGLIGQKIASTMASTGTPAFFLHPAEGIHGDLGMIMAGDVVIGISNSGETEELLRILPVIKRLGARLIAMTGNADSNLAKTSDVLLQVSVAE